jgi:hypothetical protein
MRTVAPLAQPTRADDNDGRDKPESDDFNRPAQTAETPAGASPIDLGRGPKRAR